ncbi:MAG: ISNCY family transposase [Gemmatimonadetes bacterium]|nr:ISNCY family transposase [Gemmatimonadota bacterium]
MTAATRRQLSFADLEFLHQGVRLEPLLQSISDFLDGQTDLLELVRADLERGLSNPAAGRRRRLTPQQVLRSLTLQRVKNWDYRELRERIADGYTLRRFTEFFSQPVPKHDAFHRAFRRLRPETLRTINERVVEAAVAQGLEDGKKLRVDTTVVETDIHHPTDNKLLWDTVRVVTRLVGRLQEYFADGIVHFRNRTRSARRRALEIERLTARQRPQQQMGKYRELIRIANHVLTEARAVLQATKATATIQLVSLILIEQLRHEITHYCDLGQRVIDQTRRRVLHGEQVPVEEKIFSIFEPHTDLIKRGKALKPVEFGHKVFLAESARGLITQYDVLDGNPADTDHVRPSLQRHAETFGRSPDLYAADRGFDSIANLKACQDAGVKLACIPQCGGKKVPEREALEKRTDFKRGQRFRAGVEGRISVLFRGRGMKRCLAEGRERFEVFVGTTVLANNLLAIGELRLQNQKRRRRAA